MVRRVPPRPSLVTVIADNPKTLETIHLYFTRAGVTSVGTNQLGDTSVVPPESTTLVLFPDEYQRRDVEIFLPALRRRRPQLLILLVSSAPQDLGAALEPDGHSLPPVVLPKPAFGWTLLDAIRNRAAESGAD